MKLSVIIPVFNQEKLIIKTLDSIPKKNNIEVIIVNDCSIDKTKSVVTKYIKKYDNYTLINLRKNKGVGNARNKGIDKAIGEYLYFLDSDDTFDKKGVKELQDDLDGSDVLYFGLRKNDGTEIFKTDKNGVIRCIRREFLGLLRYPEMRVKEDVEFYKNVMEKNPTKKFLDYVVWNYNYPREGSLCWEHKKRLILTVIVPVYNTEYLITRCLDSIELSENIEIIIIDDCSTDNSLLRIEEWVSKTDFKNITVIYNEENLGAGPTVNKGYDAMKGEYVFTLCDDDYLIGSLNNYIGYLHSGFDLVYFNAESNTGRIWQGQELPGSTKAYSKEIIGNTRRPSQNFGGDKVFYDEILAKNPTKRYTELLLYYYNYPRKGSLMYHWNKEKRELAGKGSKFKELVRVEEEKVMEVKEENFSITVFTIAYNGYGEFIPKWIDSMKNQNVQPDKIIIVLGKDSGILNTKLMARGINCEVINVDDDVMGILRNKGIKAIDTEWMLYFSADDILLPNAIEEIKKKASEGYEAVALRYIDRQINGTERVRPSAIFDRENMLRWQKKYPVPGYIAVKRKHKGKILYYEDIEIPNYPYLFQLVQRGVKQTHSNKECCMYVRRAKSHGGISSRTGKFRDYAKVIDERARYYLN